MENYIKIFAACLSVITAFSSYGQAGTIKGSLQNKYTNESIINTKVTFVLNDSIYKTTTTDSEGFFIITQINPQRYKLKVVVYNYKEVTKKKIFVEDVRTCYLNLKLEPIRGLNEN